MLATITVIWFLIYFFFYVRFSDHRREMLWASGLSVPLAALWSVASYDLQADVYTALISILLKIVFGALFAGVAAAMYELFFHKGLKLVPHPHRAKLTQLFVGPLVFLVSVLIFQWPGVWALLLGFLAEILVLTYHRKELLWEAIVSGLFMATIYVIVFLITSRFSADSGLSFGTAGFSGIDVLGLPIEEILLVFGYGMLWGPLYEGVKKGQGKLV